jgi:hypothetical protein
VSVGAEPTEVASGFLAALEEAARSGNREPVFLWLAPDVEWVIPARTLQGIDEVREKHTWGYPPEHFDVEFEAGEWVDLGGGRLSCDLREIYRWKETGEPAQHQDRRIQVEIRQGKVRRYEMRVVG